MVPALVMLTGAVLLVGGLLVFHAAAGAEAELLAVLVIVWGSVLHIGACLALVARAGREDESAESKKHQGPDQPE